MGELGKQDFELSKYNHLFNFEAEKYKGDFDATLTQPQEQLANYFEVRNSRDSSK